VNGDEQREVGERIAEARRHGGLTQRELAALLGVTVRTIQNYEAGVAVPYRHLRTIESVGRKRPGWILEGGEDSDLRATISSLQRAMEQHQELMQRHLQEMSVHMERLRAQRDASVERRGRRDT
jgi:transcriptional regulator with XRE-family HTH domain